MRYNLGNRVYNHFLKRASVRGVFTGFRKPVNVGTNALAADEVSGSGIQRSSQRQLLLRPKLYEEGTSRGGP